MRRSALGMWFRSFPRSAAARHRCRMPLLTSGRPLCLARTCATAVQSYYRWVPAANGFAWRSSSVLTGIPMAQAFSTRAVLSLKLGFIGALAAVAVIWLTLRADVGPMQEEPVQQSVPFSHKHHVADDGIDCRYCHTTVETAAFAGVPPLSTCMSCHSQLYTQQPPLRPLIDAWEGGPALR